MDGTSRSEEQQQEPDTSSVKDKLRWFLYTDKKSIASLRGLLAGVLLATLTVTILFSYTGVWPPLTAVTSGSMEPNINENDLIILNDPDTPEEDGSIKDTGIVPYQSGEITNYEQFNKPGDVIIFSADGDGDAIIHRAHFYVEEGEDWYHRGDSAYMGQASNCEELSNCPAPNDGFITKGDNNPLYDQVGHTPLSKPVHPEWVQSEAQSNWAYLGHIRGIAGLLFLVGSFLIVRDLIK